MFALALTLSVVALLVGPVLVVIGRGRAMPLAAIAGLALGLIPTLIVVRLLPHLWATLGPLAGFLVALAYGGSYFIDRHDARGAVGAVVVVPAMAVHSFADGAALAVAFAESSGSAPTMLAFALVAHRLPEGLFLGATLVPRIGLRRTCAVVGVLALSTVVGAIGGHALLADVTDRVLHGAVALGLGVMLRVVLHQHEPRQEHMVLRRCSLVIGVVVALLIPFD